MFEHNRFLTKPRRLLRSMALVWVLSAGAEGAIQASATTYVWDFSEATAASPGEPSAVTAQLLGYITEDFEEALVGEGCVTVLERRQHSRLAAHAQNEKAIVELAGLPATDSDYLQSVGANSVVFGTVRDDVNSGSLKVAIKMETFSGEIVVSQSVDLRRGLRLDATSRRTELTQLARALCSQAVQGDEVPWKPGLLGRFFNVKNIASWNPEVAQESLVQVANGLNFNWGNGSPHERIGRDYFTGNWTGEIYLETAGTYTFVVESDNGVRIWIDGRLVLDEWRLGMNEVYSQVRPAPFDLEFKVPGWKPIRVDYYEQTRSAKLDIRWWPPGSTADKALAISSNELRHR